MAKVTPPVGNFTSMTKEAQDALIQLVTGSVTMFGSTYNIRERMREIDQAYIRQSDTTAETIKADIAAARKDPTKFRNVIIPIVKPQVESAVAHLSDIFLSGIPIFGVTAAEPYTDAAMQMESLLRDQEEYGGWSAQLQSCFRDGKKYNLMAAEVTWTRDNLTRIKNSNDGTGQNMSEVDTSVIWEGNKITRLDLYNTFWDLRCPPGRVHVDGEFAGYNELMSRTKLIRHMWKLGNTQMNRKEAIESRTTFTGDATATSSSYHIPEINLRAIVDSKHAAFNWATWFGITESKESAIKLANSYLVTTVYVRIIPKDYGLNVPAPKTPAIWKLVIVNGQHIIYAENMRSAHDYLPIIISAMDCSDLGYQDTGLAEEMVPFQRLASGYANAGVASMRKAIGDRMFYDPTKVSKEDIDSDNPSARIPVKSAHYGKPLNEAVFPITYRDEISAIAMQGVQQISAYANQASGQNAAMQGQFVKGNKTLHEYADIMNNSNGRNVNTAVHVENNFMKPIKDILRMNILQFQGPAQVYSPDNTQIVDVDPVLLRNAIFKFKMSDGLTPSDKVMHADSFATAFQMIATSPQLQQEFNVGELATYLMKQQRADVSPFRKSQAQIAYEQAAGQWQQVAMMIAEGKAPNMQLPPQPKPADFGWDPNKPNAPVPAGDPQGKPGIMAQVAQLSAAQQNSAGTESASTQPPNPGV